MYSKPINAELTAILRDAAAWRLIALLFESPREGWHDDVRNLAGEVHDAELKKAAAAAQGEASEALYHTTFGPGGPAGCREAGFREPLLAGQALAQLRGLYEAFAYSPAIPEAPDHVAVLAGFVAYLRFKEVYARLEADPAQAATAAAAAGRVLTDHLSPIATPLAESLAASGISYLAGAARALAARAVPAG
jgi:nitrate reductase assembly molybdenum cofactor insertion protein NarJ